MTIEEKKADFMRRFKASRERKAEYIAQMEKRMRDDYRRRTGKEGRVGFRKTLPLAKGRRRDSKKYTFLFKSFFKAFSPSYTTPP